MLDPELLKLSSDGTKAELKVIPAQHGPVSEEQLRQLLALPIVANMRPLDSVVQTAVAVINKLCGTDEGKHQQFFTLAEKDDGKVKINISQDRMQAEMEIITAFGGKEIGLPDILMALKTNGVSMGISKGRIEQMLHQLPLMKPGSHIKQAIAFGKPAINGTDATIERKVPLARERLLQPQERPDGTVDMRNLGAIITVKPNETLMVKRPATAGTAGFTVKGEVLQPKPGKDVLLSAGAGTAISPTDPNKLIATVAGQPVETRGGIQIDDVLEIKEVDVKFGHVNFNGSVLITGDVHEGMHVRSSGDVTIMGFVDSAKIEAEGDITVNKGVIGHQLSDGTYSTSLTAKGQIAAQFVQYSNLNADGDILVTKQLLHSRTNTGSKLTISDNSGKRGDLIGGQIYTAKGLQVVMLGATSGTNTEVFCAMELNERRAELKALDESVKAMMTASLEIDARIRKLSQTNDPQVNLLVNEKLRINQERLREEQLHETLKQEIDTYYDNYRITVLKHIFTNVELHIGDAFQRTQREHSACTVCNQNKEIIFDYTTK